ncbi:MAG: DUF3971 domain-containing protein [Phycisphaeraceae bacterium]
MAHNPLAGKPRGTRRWRRRLAGIALIAVLALLLTGYLATRPDRLARLVAAAVARQTGAEVAIARAELSWDGGLELEDLRIRVPDMPGPAGRLVSTELAQVQLRPGALLGGELDITSVRLLRPTIHLTQNLETGRYNYQQLRISAGSLKAVLPEDLPEVLLREAGVHFAQTRGSEVQPLARLDLGGRLQRSSRRAGLFLFLLEQRPEHPGATGPTVQGTIDLKKHRVAARLDGFRFDRDQQRLLPVAMRDLWQQLSPEGELPSLRVEYDARRDHPLRARLAVRDVALTLPLPGINTRMTGVSGRFLLQRGRLLIRDLEGAVEGIRYHVAGDIDGTRLDPDLPLEIDVRTDPFDLPETPRYLEALPRLAQKLHRNLQPSGRYQVRFTLQRDEADQPLRYRGRLDLLNAEMTYHKFAYPLRELEGTVQFDQDDIRLDRLTGVGPTGGRVSLTGRIWPPGDHPAAETRITATDIPLDEHLTAALKDGHAAAMNMLLSRPAWERLAERGLIRSAATRADRAPAGALPFDLGGTIDLDIRTQRARGAGRKVKAWADIDARGTRLLMGPWPYPLEIVDGIITLSPTEVGVHHLRARGPTGAVGTVDGHLRRLPGDTGVTPDLRITDAAAPIDELLLAAIPEPHDAVLRSLHPAGRVACEGRLFRNDAGEFDFQLNLDVLGGRVRPFGGEMVLESLTGRGVVRRGGLTIDPLHARRGEGKLTATGELKWNDAGRPAGGELRFAASDLEIEPGLANLVPPELPLRAKLAEGFEQYHPAGRTDAALRLPLPASAEAAEYDLTLRPRRLALDLRDQRLEFTDIAGEVRMQPGEVELDKLSGSFEDGTLTLDGRVQPGEKIAADLTISAEGKRTGPATQALLPTDLRERIEHIGLSGGYRLDQATLRLTPDPDAGPEARFAGRVELRSGAGELGILPVSDASGSAELIWTRFPGQSHPEIEAVVTAPRLRVADRLIAPLSLSVTTRDDRPGLLTVADLRGQVYGGVLVGSGWFEMDGEQKYQLDLTLQEARVEPLIEPEATGTDENKKETGRLSASLRMEARMGDAASPRGRGAVTVRDARLVARPLLLAVLQTVSFSLPTSGSFDRAAAGYLIHGSTIRLDRLSLEAPSIAISGSGSLEVPSRELDLTLYARNPAGGLGVVGEMMQVLKDQLMCVRVRGTLDQPDASLVGPQARERE